MNSCGASLHPREPPSAVIVVQRGYFLTAMDDTVCDVQGTWMRKGNREFAVLSLPLFCKYKILKSILS